MNIVYCYRGHIDIRDDMNIVYCYDPAQDKWTTLPPLPVRWFCLGHVNGKLVAVGGRKVIGFHEVDVKEEYTYYDEQSQEWKQTVPHMPTARRYPSIYTCLHTSFPD